MDSQDIIEELRYKLELTRNHNIHFMNLITNNDLKGKWGEIASYIGPNKYQTILMFNFIGAKFEDRMEIPKGLFERYEAMSQKKQDMTLGLGAQISYTEEHIEFLIAESLGLDIEKIESFLKEQVEAIFN
jgi:hypothetical protein